MNKITQNTIPTGSRRPEFQELLTYRHPLATKHRGLSRGVRRRQLTLQLREERRRRKFGCNVNQSKPRVLPWDWLEQLRARP